MMYTRGVLPSMRAFMSVLLDLTIWSQPLMTCESGQSLCEDRMPSQSCDAANLIVEPLRVIQALDVLAQDLDVCGSTGIVENLVIVG